MIGRIDPSQLGAQQRAELIYAQARSELSSRLWQAALGTGERGVEGQPTSMPRASELNLEALLATLANDHAKPVVLPRPPQPAIAQAATAPDRRETSDERGERSRAPVEAAEAMGLGPNAQYRATLMAAADRTAIPAAALAAIVHAEAAKGPGGRWLAYSRNPRSSAAGLGQFLSGTWKSEAEREGSWLNTLARQKGWLNARGKVAGEARAELLALRYDPHASIQAIADYARANLDTLERKGVRIEGDVESTAQAAYLGHHLGIGDAVKFLKGGLDSARARTLLSAQIGSVSAGQRIASAGSATGAHRAWLLDYVDRNIRPARFDGALPVG
ncbi:peptidoglycan-binding protein [Sphingomonas cavernae]|uniref:Peptidoglycan-binding protein n=1 Tax=Sphingomonas cavernae TaxID=2320861 RepID=A0A418W6Z2_9SPHN|nr:peptidoglycan-binding protein [Sphingomonas cavernae]RJF85738.1 peptidoglycan-binding protein [Sphingomonas cavernae]